MGVVNNIKTDLYLTLSQQGLDKIAKVAKKEAEEEFGEKEIEGMEFYCPDAIMDINEMYFDEKSEELNFNGEISAHGHKIGYLSFQLSLPLEVSIDMISYHIKKLQKLKTVLEAIK